MYVSSIARDRLHPYGLNNIALIIVQVVIIHSLCLNFVLLILFCFALEPIFLSTPYVSWCQQTREAVCFRTCEPMKKCVAFLQTKWVANTHKFRGGKTPVPIINRQKRHWKANRTKEHEQISIDIETDKKSWVDQN